jgi:hypothetical protein
MPNQTEITTLQKQLQKATKAIPKRYKEYRDFFRNSTLKLAQEDSTFALQLKNFLTSGGSFRAIENSASYQGYYDRTDNTVHIEIYDLTGQHGPAPTTTCLKYFTQRFESILRHEMDHTQAPDPYNDILDKHPKYRNIPIKEIPKMVRLKFEKNKLANSIVVEQAVKMANTLFNTVNCLQKHPKNINPSVLQRLGKQFNNHKQHKTYRSYSNDNTYKNVEKDINNFGSATVRLFNPNKSAAPVSFWLDQCPVTVILPGSTEQIIIRLLTHDITTALRHSKLSTKQQYQKRLYNTLGAEVIEMWQGLSSQERIVLNKIYNIQEIMLDNFNYDKYCYTEHLEPCNTDNCVEKFFRCTCEQDYGDRNIIGSQFESFCEEGFVTEVNAVLRENSILSASGSSCNSDPLFPKSETWEQICLDTEALRMLCTPGVKKNQPQSKQKPKISTAASSKEKQVGQWQSAAEHFTFAFGLSVLREIISSLFSTPKAKRIASIAVDTTYTITASIIEYYNSKEENRSLNTAILLPTTIALAHEALSVICVNRKGLLLVMNFSTPFVTSIIIYGISNTFGLVPAILLTSGASFCGNLIGSGVGSYIVNFWQKSAQQQQTTTLKQNNTKEKITLREEQSEQKITASSSNNKTDRCCSFSNCFSILFSVPKQIYSCLTGSGRKEQTASQVKPHCF